MEKDLVVSDFDICVGVIASANGIKGYVKIKCFTDDPRDIESFTEVIDIRSRRVFVIKVRSIRNDCIIASIEGVETRNDAEQLQNVKLYIKRSELPAPNADEYYHADLVGCSVKLENGQLLGKIKNVHNFGASDLIEVHNDVSNEDTYYPFNKDFVKEVSLKDKLVILDLVDTT